MILLFLKTLTRTREDAEAESVTRQVGLWERAHWWKIKGRWEQESQQGAAMRAIPQNKTPVWYGALIENKIIFKTISVLFSSDCCHSWVLLLLSHLQRGKMISLLHLQCNPLGNHNISCLVWSFPCVTTGQNKRRHSSSVSSVSKFRLMWSLTRCELQQQTCRETAML